MNKKHAFISLLCAFLALPVLSHAQAATVSLAWDAPDAASAPLINGYNLYRKFEACAINPAIPIPTRVGTVASPTAVTMADTVNVNGVFCYELTAFNAAGESPRSNRVDVPITSIKPNKPGNVRIVVTVTP